MAENKKSFVLYADLIHTFEGLEDDEAGKLIKHVLRYVNDLNPISDNKIVNIAFTPIKQQLKRDLIKYEVKKRQWSEAGKKSAEKKKKKGNGRSTDSTNVGFRSTDSTVNVNDSVNVNVLHTPVSEFNYSFIEEVWKVPFGTWVKYKSEIKKPFTTQMSLEASYREMKELSGNSTLEALKIIQYSISNQYLSLCKPSANKKDIQTHNLQGTL